MRRFRAVLRGSLVLLVIGGALAGLATFVGTSLVAVRTDLLAVRASLQEGVTAGSAGDVEAAAVAFDRASQQSATAVERVHSPQVRFVGLIPVLGRAVQSGTAVAESTNLIAQAGQGLMTAVQAVPGGLDAITFGAGGDQEWLASVASMQTPLSDALTQLSLARDLIAAAPEETLVPQVDAARLELATQMDTVVSTLERGQALSQVLPDLLGANGTRRYFLGAQNPTELRGTGGLIGAYAVLTADNGQIEISPFQTVTGLADELLNEETAPSAEFLERYESFLRGNGTWSNINATPDFPSAATAIENFFGQATDTHVDGVIVLDPFALEAMIEVTGPVQTEEVGLLQPATLVSYLTEEAPTEFESGGERKEVLGEAAGAVLEVFLSGDVSGPARVRALAEGAAGGHLLVHTIHPQVQAALVRVGVAGELPPPEPGVLGISGYNLVETKGDLFVHRDVDYEVYLNPDGSATGIITTTLRNEAPSEGRLPYFIGPNVDDRDLEPGDNATMLSVYCGSCEHVDSQFTDEWDFDLWWDQELGHNVLTTIERVDQDETQSVRHVVRLPAMWDRTGAEGTASVLLWNQPTINPTTWTVTVHAPAGWTFDGEGTREDMELSAQTLRWTGDPARTERLTLGLTQVVR